MSVELYRESHGKFDSRTLNRKTLSRWTERKWHWSVLEVPSWRARELTKRCGCLFRRRNTAAESFQTIADVNGFQHRELANYCGCVFLRVSYDSTWVRSSGSGFLRKPMGASGRTTVFHKMLREACFFTESPNISGHFGNSRSNVIWDSLNSGNLRENYT